MTSHYARDNLLLAFPLDPEIIHLLHNGINPEFLEPQPVSRRQGVLFFGRFAHEKGLDLVLHAYSQLPSDVRNRHPLTLVGSGALDSKLKKQIRSPDLRQQIKVLNWMAPGKLARVIASQALVVLPLREESFGNAQGKRAILPLHSHLLRPTRLIFAVSVWTEPHFQIHDGQETKFDSLQIEPVLLHQ